MKIVIIAFMLIAVSCISGAALSQSVFTKEFKCGVEGCDITCITKSKGVLQTKAAREVTMTVYPDGIIIYEAELGLGEKDTIVTGDSGVCKIHRHK